MLARSIDRLTNFNSMIVKQASRGFGTTYILGYSHGEQNQTGESSIGQTRSTRHKHATVTAQKARLFESQIALLRQLALLWKALILPVLKYLKASRPRFLHL